MIRGTVFDECIGNHYIMMCIICGSIFYLHIFFPEEPIFVHRGPIGEEQTLPIESIEEFEVLNGYYIHTSYCKKDYCNGSSQISLSFSLGFVVIAAFMLKKM